MKKRLCILLTACLCFCLPAHSQVQADSLACYNIIASEEQTDGKPVFHPKQLIFPAVAITLGSVGASTSFGKKVNREVRDALRYRDHKIKADDYLQYLPVVSVYGLSLLGAPAKHDYLERTKFDSDIYITVDTLKYLKKGGRCTPAAAALGAVLGIKPVLRIKGEKLDSFAKVRGWKAAKKAMIDAIHHTMDTEFAGLSGPEQLHIAAAYTGERADAQEWLEELEALFPGYPIHMDPLSLSVACHIGPGARAVTVTKALEK